MELPKTSGHTHGSTALSLDQVREVITGLVEMLARAGSDARLAHGGLVPSQATTLIAD